MAWGSGPLKSPLPTKLLLRWEDIQADHLDELFAGSGMRSARYLLEGGADFVWANDANQELFQTLLANLQQDYPCSDLLPEWAAPHSWRLQEGLPLHGREAGRHPGWRHRSSADKDSSTSAQGWRVTHWESKSLLGYCQAVNRQFDFVDVDASGCWSHIGATLELVRPGGLLYLAATGLTSSKPSLAFQSLGVRMARCPPTETLHDHMARALIWRMVSAADSLGLIAQPLFSLYRGAGDVFRILLRVVRRSGESTLKAFCCGVCCDCNIYVGPLEDESLFGARHARSRCRNCHSSDFVCWGPLWTGSLNSDPFLAQLQADAAVRGWLQEPLSEGGRMSPLAELLPRLRAEASAEAAAEAAGEVGYSQKRRESSAGKRGNAPTLAAILPIRLDAEAVLLADKELSADVGQTLAQIVVSGSSGIGVCRGCAMSSPAVTLGTAIPPEASGMSQKMLSHLGIAPKITPAYDGTTVWFEYEQLIDDWRDITTLDAWKGNQDFVTWIAKFDKVLQSLRNSWMDFLPEDATFVCQFKHRNRAREDARRRLVLKTNTSVTENLTELKATGFNTRINNLFEQLVDKLGQEQGNLYLCFLFKIAAVMDWTAYSWSDMQMINFCLHFVDKGSCAATLEVIALVHPKPNTIEVGVKGCVMKASFTSVAIKEKSREFVWSTKKVVAVVVVVLLWAASRSLRCFVLGPIIPPGILPLTIMPLSFCLPGASASGSFATFSFAFAAACGSTLHFPCLETSLEPRVVPFVICPEGIIICFKEAFCAILFVFDPIAFLTVQVAFLDHQKGLAATVSRRSEGRIIDGSLCVAKDLEIEVGQRDRKLSKYFTPLFGSFRRTNCFVRHKTAVLWWSPAGKLKVGAILGDGIAAEMLAIALSTDRAPENCSSSSPHLSEVYRSDSGHLHLGETHRGSGCLPGLELERTYGAQLQSWYSVMLVVVMGDSRKADIAMCVFSSLLATHQLASAGMSINGAVATCGWGGMEEKTEACVANIGNTLATLSGTAAFLTELALNCPTDSVDWRAGCAAPIATLLSGLGGLVGHSSGVSQACDAEKIENGATIFNPVNVNDETGMANCILNADQAAFFAGRAGLNVNALANGDCSGQNSKAVAWLCFSTP
ncbi:unnamed protein product [Symbiodinium sp. KB8]|nr:unnamed protein product [Symbiodinium sp. KB8]